ncbi:MIF4G-like type 3 [Lasiodiplodia theobromae]|uniref:Eukaryotic translation initiation factor 4 gamma n=1 Tax=Lasiodiplodia theobromae TaxID=45133 RepID=A0A5N5CX54_9PEZI|nr:Eukaryotic translation initiation factor 4 gamma [Lasiodiplodia theobromae]KAF9631575.1 MIF4G-like type 3 [Lasiodiplodia theobromae]
MSSSSPATNPTTNAAQTANAASNQSTGTTSPSVAGAAQPAAKSYASAATKKSASPPAIASSTPQVAVGSAQHGKTGSVNGKSQIQPAVPAVGPAPIANGAPAHGRKPSSMTISAAGTSGPMANGSNNRPNISFGSMNAGGSPAIANSVPQAPQNSTPNPRITSPATSPSPIPQPPASGGRPPASLQGQGNSLSFGSMGGENGGQSGRPVSMPPQGPPPMPQAQHLRRESSQSAHSDMSNPAMNRNFVPQAGRGRGYNGGYNAPSPGPQFRQPLNQMRGPMPGQFQGQGGPMGSPYRQNRSPAMTPATMHQQAQFANQPQMPHAGYPGYPHQFQPNAQGFYGMQPQHLDPTQFNPYYQPAPYMHATMPYQTGAPPSPRPMNHAPHAAQPFIPGQYGAPHAQSMSRTNSQVSERPPSTMANPQTPSMAAASHVSHTPTQSSSSPAPSSSNFTIPARTKSKGIVIKNPDGEVVTFEKKSSSPAPGPSKSPIVVSSTPTPPPRAPSANSQHGRTDSTTQKTAEEKKAEFQEQFQKQLAEERRRKEEEERLTKEKKEKEEKEAAEAQAAKDKAEAEEKAAKEREAAEAAAKEEAEKKAKEEAEKKAKEEEEKKAKEAEEEAAKKAKEEEAERLRKEEDERLEREIAEMEAAEREEEEREKAFQEKRKRDKEEAEAKAAEAAAKADEEMKRLEREAEERELAKERGEKKEQSEEDKAEAAKLFASLKKPTFGPGAAAAEAEPAASDAMPPPAQPASKAAAAKPKPAALKLETRKPVEPPAPTPGMQSLKSARFLRVQNDDLRYPEGIKSPNPALNQGRGGKGFKYDKDFLLQFQEVFKEKPSVDWDNRVRETVGDGGDSARPGSARTPSNLGSRGSRTMPLVGGSIGNFALNSRTLPPGTTSKQRFEISNSLTSRSSSANPMASFSARPGSFPMAPGIGGRSASSYAPAAGNSSRSGSGRKNQSRRGNASKRDEEKNMPLTAGVEVAPLVKSTTGWVPTSLTQPAQPAVAAGNLTPDVVQRKVKAALNKMTPEKFDRIADQILEIAKQSENETDGRTLRQVIQLTFEKACDEAHWASMYAKFCKRMLETMSPAIKDEKVRDKNDNPVVGGNLFRKYLLNRCQEDFERGWEANLPMKKEGESEEAAMLSDEYYVAAAAKRRGLGLIQFIGELYKLGMLTVRIMHECVMRLLNFEGVPDESNIESLVKLLRTVGATMETSEAGAQMIRAYFERIEKVKDLPALPSRMHFMLLDLVDLKRSGWKSKDDAKGPKTIQEIHEEALAAQQQAELEKARNPPRGGRPPLGRGDARSFSGGGMMPPPDYKHNTLGMDDLRKLSKNASGRTSSSGPGTFGPSSLFAGRSGSGRRNLGPGGGLNRTGDDSGNSSRTGTPPVKEKETQPTHTNSFSALAALEGGDDGGHEAASPEPSKVQPATTGGEKKEGAGAPATES